MSVTEQTTSEIEEAVAQQSAAMTADNDVDPEFRTTLAWWTNNLHMCMGCAHDLQNFKKEGYLSWSNQVSHWCIWSRSEEEDEVAAGNEGEPDALDNESEAMKDDVLQDDTQEVTTKEL